MKKTNSILRMLYLIALLCMTSVSASAYKVYDANFDFNKISESMGSDKILVIKYSMDTKYFYCPSGYAFIIMPGVTVTAFDMFENQGNLYVFGELNNSKTTIMNANSYGNIYLVDGGNVKKTTLISGYQWPNQPITTNFSNIAAARKIQDCSFPVTTTSGWNNYWEQGIACGDDFYPRGGFFEDEACTKPITDLEAWKAAHSNIDLGLKIDGTTYENWEYWDTNEKQGFFYNDNLTLSDGVNYQSAADFSVDGTFTYIRSVSGVKQGAWQCWYEPFDVELKTDVLAMMDVAEVAGVLLDNEGNTVVAFRKIDTGWMKANTPYVFRPKDKILTAGSLKLEMKNAELRKSEETTFYNMSTYDKFTFGGNYTAQHNDNWYTLNTSGVFQQMKEGVNLKGQRFWMTIEARNGIPYEYGGIANAKEFINFTVLGDDEPTGIENLTPASPEGKGVIYNLNGQKVTSIQSGQVYIMDGKKFLAK